MATPVPSPASASPHTRASPAAAQEIAIDTYVYAYPLVLSELTRRVSVGGASDAAPMNQFHHRREFPDPSFTEVVRPNADTLYSILWFDVSEEPLAISVPDSHGRYYLLSMLDLWSDVFAAPGSRTTGTSAQLIVLAAASWTGDIPRGALLIRSPTTIGWVIGRTQTNGTKDYANVHRFQADVTVTTLSDLGRPSTASKAIIDPSWDLDTPPVALIEKMGAQEYFGLFAELLKLNPPHPNDYPIVHRMAGLGIVPGKSFPLAAAPAGIRQACEAASAPALKTIKAGATGQGVVRHGWRTRLSTIGTYGTDYRTRAAIAFSGLGANPVEDAVYPSALTDSDGRPFSSDGRYVLHLSKDQMPPVNAFWSLTMYDERQLFAANAINRYAIGDRDALAVNADGSLDIHIQRAPPGDDKESNWLPAPAAGAFTMNLRLYWPKNDVLDGAWTPPPVRRID